MQFRQAVHIKPDSSSKTFAGFPSLGVKNCFLFKVKLLVLSNSYYQTENPGNVLLASRICLKSFYQCVSVPNNKVGVNLINKPMGSKGLLNVIRFMILPTHLASQELWLK